MKKPKITTCTTEHAMSLKGVLRATDYTVDEKTLKSRQVNCGVEKFIDETLKELLSH